MVDSNHWELLERAVGRPIQGTELEQRAVGVLDGRTPSSKHRAGSLNKLWEEVDAHQSVKINLATISNALHFLVEVVWDVGLGQGPSEVERSLDSVFSYNSLQEGRKLLQVLHDLVLNVDHHFGEQLVDLRSNQLAIGIPHLIWGSPDVQQRNVGLDIVDQGVELTIGDSLNERRLAGPDRQVVWLAAALQLLNK